MKRLVTFIIITLFLISLVIAGVTTSAIDNKNKSPNQINAAGNPTDAEIQARIRASTTNRLTDEQIQKIFTLRNRIRAVVASGECPEKCTCTGSVTKCQLRNGTREMTVVAGRSGNIIVQTKGVNASTNVELYKAEGKLYGVFKDNETRTIKLLPDQVREKIRERLARQLEDENITLDEDNVYRYSAEKRARLFSIFPVKVRVNAELDPETGKILRLRNSWWAFLARDEGEEILGASCGTVSPDSRNECCQNKDFDFYNTETGECEFNIE